MIKTREDIALLREGGALLAHVLQKVIAHVAPGVSTLDLNAIAEKEIRALGGRPSFLGYGGDKEGRGAFPGALCTSRNDEIVHTIPRSEDILRDGDIIGLDIGMEYKGLYTDHAITVPVGTITPDAQKLLDTTRESLYAGIRQLKPGNTLGDVGHAVQRVIEREGFGVVRALVGHGVGYEVHEEPQVPNFGKPGKGLRLQPGMVLAIEPMANMGDPDVTFTDHWKVCTRDGSLSAHFEHTVVVTENGADILTQETPDHGHR